MNSHFAAALSTCTLGPKTHLFANFVGMLCLAALMMSAAADPAHPGQTVTAYNTSMINDYTFNGTTTQNYSCNATWAESYCGAFDIF